MYHIKNDKRARTSAAEITQGMYRCLQTTPLGSVTVSDLHRETGISRATIYRLFDTPEDVLIYQIDCTMNWVTQYYEQHRNEPASKVFKGVLNLGLENHELVEALVKNGRFDLLHDYTERTFGILHDLFADYMKEMDEIEADYVLSSLAMNMVSSLSTWIRRGQVETVEQLSGYTRRFLQVMNIMTAEDAGREGVTDSRLL